MKHCYSINYENVHLRPLSFCDIENLRVWRNEPRNTKYLNKLPIITPEMQKSWYERYLENKDELCFAIVEVNELKRIVGSLSLYGFERNTCYLGKILVGDLEAHGKKVGVNAIKAVLNIAFNQLDINTVNLHVYAENIVALKVYKAAGFEMVEEHIAENGKVEYTMNKKIGGKNYAQYE